MFKGFFKIINSTIEYYNWANEETSRKCHTRKLGCTNYIESHKFQVDMESVNYIWSITSDWIWSDPSDTWKHKQTVISGLPTNLSNTRKWGVLYDCIISYNPTFPNCLFSLQFILQLNIVFSKQTIDTDHTKTFYGQTLQLYMLFWKNCKLRQCYHLNIS